MSTQRALSCDEKSPVGLIARRRSRPGHHDSDLVRSPDVVNLLPVIGLVAALSSVHGLWRGASIVNPAVAGSSSCVQRGDSDKLSFNRDKVSGLFCQLAAQTASKLEAIGPPVERASTW
jgi:hypothetical protein